MLKLDQSPKESKSQRIGRIGAKCFISQIPDSWLPSSQSESDYGFDYWVHLQDPIRRHIRTGFLIQLKTQAKARIKNGYVSIPLDVKNLNYYNNIACPLMLVYCDLQEYDDSLKYNINNADIYYCWYQNIELIPYKQSYLIKIPITNKLNGTMDLDDDLEKFIHEFQSFTTFKKYQNAYFPKKFIHEERISQEICTFSTNHINLTAFLPSLKKIDTSSCLILFALQGADDCMMTFNHKSILHDLFCGSLNQTSSLNRKFIVSEKWDDKNSFFVQLGNCRYLLQKEHVYELCSVIDRFFYQYRNNLWQIDNRFKLRNFTYDKYARGFKLVTVPLVIWNEILLIADEFSYDKGKSDWHIFYKKSNYSIAIELLDENTKQFKFFAKIKAIKEYDRDIFIADTNVSIIWEYPKYEMQNKPNCNSDSIWDLETCYQWLIEKLLPFTMQHGKERLTLKTKIPFISMRKKYYNNIFHYIDREGFSNFIKFHRAEHLIDNSSVENHEMLKILINQIHIFFSEHAGSTQLKINYSQANSTSFIEAIILTLEHTNNYDVHYLNSKLLDTGSPQCKNKEEFITALKNCKTTILNDYLLEYKLRAFKALVEDSNTLIPCPIVKKIHKKIEWIYLIIENHLLIERFLYLQDW